MSSEENKEVVRRFVAASNARDRAAMAEVVASDVTRQSPSTPGVKVESFDDLWAFFERDAASIPDNVVKVETMVAEDDLVAVWATYSGTQEGSMGPFPPSGASASTHFAGFLRIRDGKIADMRVVWDNLDMLTQLGHLQPMSG